MNETPRFSFLRVWRDVSSTFVNRDFLILFVGALITAGISGTTDTLGTLCEHLLLGPGAGAAAVLQPGHRRRHRRLSSTLGFIGRLFDKKTVLLASFALLMVDGVGVIVLRLAAPDASRTARPPC